MMKSQMGFITSAQTKWVLVVLIILASLNSVARAHYSPMKLGVHDPDGAQPKTSTGFETYYYEQTLDHFNFNPESYTTFNQKYLINYKSWDARHTPIFVYLGAEAPLTAGLNILTDHADEFHALLLYIEHRFYGESIPFGMTMGEVVSNATVRGYFNSAQALADYAEVILYVKEKLHAPYAPVVVFGGSYGGMLASWFRLKYPHVAVGALASSAPILYFDRITPPDAYYLVVTKDFRETSETCYETIRDSWEEMDRVANQTNGLSILTKKFNLCSELSDVWELKNYLIEKYAVAAQYGRPPVYRATTICNAIDGSHNADVLDRVFSGLVAYYGYYNKTCYNTTESSFGSQTSLGWGWQTCSDMVIPVGIGPINEMFQPQPFNMSEYMTYCNSTYDVLPRPHWMTTYFGGQNIKLILKRFGSNIIFSNGLRDPYSSAGVLEDISDTIVAIKTKKGSLRLCFCSNLTKSDSFLFFFVSEWTEFSGSHCMDFLHANASVDPKWLVHQRKEQVKVMKGWIRKYYGDLTRSSS
ncbi:hypothetical protein V2J09_022711 [Rumex salicifolius]